MSVKKAFLSLPDQGLVHCGECGVFPCELLEQYSCDPEHGDNPKGARIEQCRKWKIESFK